MSEKPIPEGYQSITPYLMVDGAARLIDFLKRAFDGKEVERMNTPDGTVGHAEVRIGDSMVMVTDARGEWKAAPCSLYLYVADVDATYKRALAAGGTSIQEPADHFYGDRSGGIKDPCGNQWWIATHKEDVPPDEMKRRAEAHYKQQKH